MIRLARVPAPAENTSLCINSPGKDPVNLLTGANALAVVPEAGGYLEAIAVNLGKFAQGAALLIILRNFYLHLMPSTAAE